MVLLAAGLGLRAGLSAWRLADAQGQPVAGWMTPRLVVRAYGIDPPALAAVLGLEPGQAPRQTLAEIAAAQGRPLEAVLAQVQALADGAR